MRTVCTDAVKRIIFSCGARFRFLSLATDTKFTAIRLSSKAACGLLSAGCSKEHPQLNILTLQLCIKQFNIIYFINYTHIVGRLAIKIFAMEENVSVQIGIGRWSSGIHGGSPKGKKLRGGLDVEAEERRAEVQKGRKRAVDWMLKRRKGVLKSKKRGEA